MIGAIYVPVIDLWQANDKTCMCLTSKIAVCKQFFSGAKLKNNFEEIWFHILLPWSILKIAVATFKTVKPPQLFCKWIYVFFSEQV